MIHQKIKDLFQSSVEHICSGISDYSVHPDIDFQRNRKLSAQKLISFLVSQGSSSTKVEMLDFWGLDDSSLPTSSALNQQRQKLKPDAMEAVFRHFNSSVMALVPNTLSDDKYRFLAADGSTCTYFSTPCFSSADYYCSPGNSIRGVYSMHLNAFYDLTTHTYTDALIQPVHCKNEFSAFCGMVDRHEVIEGRKNIYIGDRGYCSYNNMAHVLEQISSFCSVPKISTPKVWLVILTSQKKKLLILMSKLPWSEAIPGKSRSIPAHTDGLWIGRLRLIMSLMAVLTPMGLHFGL